MTAALVPVWLSRMGSLLLPAGPGRAGRGEGRAQRLALSVVPLYSAGFWACDFAFRECVVGDLPELRSFPVGPPFNPSMAACRQAPGSLQVEPAPSRPQHRPHHALLDSSFQSASLLSHPLL